MIGLSAESDKVIEMLNNWESARTSEILKDLIDEDVKSDIKKEMQEGIKYYGVKNTYITNKQFNVADVLGESVIIPDAPNNKRRHGYFRIAVDQKVGYIDEPQFQHDDESIKDIIADVTGEDFPDILNDWERGASQKGVEYLHPYISDGELNFVVFPATQIIPIYDTRFQKELVSAIRYYPYELKLGQTKKTLYKVEIYTDKEIIFYEQIDNEEYKFIERKPHFQRENTLSGVEGLSWGKVPIIELQNNTEKTSDLMLAKDLIDDYDLHKSVFSNDLESVQEALLHIQGYQLTGSTPAEKAREWAKLKKNILTLKMILTNDENAKVDAIKNEVPHAAKDSHLDRTRKEIFTLLMGVDPELVGDGNITNIVLKSRYMLLDMKAELMIAKLKKALRQLLYFVSGFAKYSSGIKDFDYKEVKINIGKNMIVNDTELIQNLVLSGDLLSEETKIAKHPYVDNLQEELERLEKDREAYQSQMPVEDDTE